jgi:intracellular multiplication protein IcmO
MGPAPFPVVLDELAYYATSGLDRMLAMGRGLNMSFMLAFQEVSGIWARLGEKTASLLGNANLTIAMRQQDSGRTREWIEKSAGQTYVTQATSYHGAMDGAYREARQAEVRPVSRVDWNDLTTLIEGEAVVLFAGRRVYAKLFHAEIDDSGPKRLGRGLMLRAPDTGEVRARRDRIGQIAAVIGGGKVGAGGEEPVSPGVAALLQGFAQAAAKKSDARGCAQAALAALAEVPAEKRAHHAPAPGDGMPVTAVTPMLFTASQFVWGGAEAEGLPNEPVDARLLRGIAAIEQFAGVPQPSTRGAALLILAGRDEALAAVNVVEPPEMDVATFKGHLAAVMRELAKLQAAAGPKRAA